MQYAGQTRCIKPSDFARNDHPSVGVALAISLYLLAAGFSFIQAFRADHLSMTTSFIAFGFEGFCIGLLLLIKACKSGIYLFEPFSMVTFVYSLNLLFAPLIQFSMGNTSRFGIDVSSNAFLATAVATFGYIAFFAAYELYHPKCHAKQRRLTDISEAIHNKQSAIIANIALILWIFSYIMCVSNYLSRGYSLLYIIFAGFGQSLDSVASEDSLAFLAYFKYALVGCWMCIFVFGDNKVQKAILFVFSFLMLLFGGSRSSLILLLLAPIAYCYIKRHSAPRIRTLVIVAAFLVFAFAIIQVARTDVRLGMGIDLSGYTLESIFTPYLNEVETYKLYYALYNVFPEKMDYLMGEQMFGQTLTMLIPRTIWPDKPEAIIYTIVYLALGLEAVLRGNAYPFIGELYAEFGIPGCVIGMLILGLICKRMIILIKRSRSRKFSLIIYCLMFAALFQFMIRGYLPSNMMMLIFLIAPVLIVKLAVSLLYGDEERPVIIKTVGDRS